MSTLESLQFDNTVLQELPVDESHQAGTRQVRGSIYSLVDPTPLASPQLVVTSPDALMLLGLDPTQAERPEFVQVMSGNGVLEGSRPAAHCYAGYQFGYFSGQLGDGAAIYLGEVVPPGGGPRQELQLKGSGLTPFSRQADGRKVLRSSMREMLASEAMDALGIPTTRGGSLVVSQQDKVLRDITYSGNPRAEPCAVVSRIAPTFIRFGSFEVCQPTDPQTGRSGPSAGMSGQLLLPLVGYVIKHHHPDLWAFYGGGDDVSMKGMAGSQVRDMVESWFSEVCRRTARLVAGWQAVGFVHGVLNTDNMCITGLTLDYGPYGFMDRFDPQHVSNGSDDGARYTYEAQFAMCKWNCERLADALGSIPLPSAAGSSADATAAEQPLAGAAAAAAGGGGGGGVGVEGAAHKSILPGAASRKGMAVFEDEFARMYRAIFRRKLGLLGRTAATAAATAATAASAASSSAAATAAAAAAGGGPGSARPIWPIASDAAAEVAAAAAAVAAAPLSPGAGGLDELDDKLIADLLVLMEDTGADFTNTFTRLVMVPMPPPSSSSSSKPSSTPATTNGTTTGSAAAAATATADGGSNGSSSSSDDFGGFLALQLSDLASPAEMAAGNTPSMPLQQVQMLSMLAGRDPAMLHMLGINPTQLSAQLARHKAAGTWACTTAAGKAASDAVKWSAWLRRYTDRLQREADEGAPPELRAAVMAASNPRVTLRNWVAQTAIRAAELGHYSTVQDILQLLRKPYCTAEEAVLEVPPAVAAAVGAAAAGPQQQQQQQQQEEAGGGSGGSCPVSVKLQFDGKPPAWAAKLCVTCSS